MRSLNRLAVLIVGLALVTAPAFADTLLLKNGTRVTGYFEGGTARVVKFRAVDGPTRDYDILQIQEILFNDVTPAPAPVTAVPAPIAVAPAAVVSASPAGPPAITSPQLRPASERPPRRGGTGPPSRGRCPR